MRTLPEIIDALLTLPRLAACTLLISLVMLLLCFVIVNGYYAYDGWLPITPHMYMIVEVSACLLALAYSPVVGLQARACNHNISPAPIPLL